jgi:hypothetical protein
VLITTPRITWRLRRAGRAKGPIHREPDRPSRADPQAPRGRERSCANVAVREDDTFPAKSPGTGLASEDGRL